MPKTRKLSLYKKDLWREFALWVKLSRSMDGLYVHCFTCGAPLQIGTANCQAGHWLPQGGYSGMVFEPNNVRPQCHRCNVRLSGNTAVFEYNLRKELGDDLVDAMYDARNCSGKRTRDWYVEKTEHYRRENKQLRSGLCFHVPHGTITENAYN
jgi:hypothetical protein